MNRRSFFTLFAGVAVVGKSANALAQGIHHKFHSAVADTADPSKIQPSNWNDALSVVTVPFGTMAAPASPVNGDLWLEVSGVSPARTLAVKAQDNGVIRTLASITF